MLEVDPQELLNVVEKFKKKMFIFCVETCNSSQILWKCQYFFHMVVEKELTENVLQFIGTSIKIENHCGVFGDFSELENIHNVAKMSLRNLKGLDLLMLAAEAGDLKSVQLLLQSGFDVNRVVHGNRAVDFAYANGHFDVVLELLKGNSQYPRNLAVELLECKGKLPRIHGNSTEADELHEFPTKAQKLDNLPEKAQKLLQFPEKDQKLHKSPENIQKLREFTEKSQKLRNFIKANDIEGISTILAELPNLRHFYCPENISAPIYAIKIGQLDIYKFLIERNVFIGPNENLEGVQLLRLHKSLIEMDLKFYLMILIGKSSFKDDKGANLKIILDAFKFLDRSHPFVSLILQVVAQSGKF